MDKISRLKFEDYLPSIINGHLRNAIIRQYQNLKGESYVPEIVPETLKWTKSDPMNILKVQINTPWCLIEKNKSTNTKYILVNIDNSKSHEMKTKDHQKLEQDLIADQQMLVIEPNAQEHVPVEMIAHSQLSVF